MKKVSAVIIVSILMLLAAAEFCHGQYHPCGNPNCLMCQRIMARQGRPYGYNGIQYQRAVQKPRVVPMTVRPVQQPVADDSAVQHSSYEALAELIPMLRLTANDTLVDIGCGDARVLIFGANAHGCRGFGIENDPRLASLARENVERTNLSDKITIHQGDATNWIGFDGMVVYVYLWEETLAKLAPGLRSAKRVLSYQHAVPGLPCYEVELRTGGRAYIYEGQQK